MEPIRDCKGRIVCMGNAKTGSLEVLYRKQRTITQIPSNGTIRIDREEVTTIITRINNEFLIESFVMIV